MGILRAKQTWRRTPTRTRELVALTPEQRANVRRVLRHLLVEHGSPGALARAMGITRAALEQAHKPSRAQSPRLAFAVARVAGVGVDEVLAGRWLRCACGECGAVVVG